MLKKKYKGKKRWMGCTFPVFNNTCPFFSYSIVTPSGPACELACRLTNDPFKAKKRKCLSEMVLDARNLGWICTKSWDGSFNFPSDISLPIILHFFMLYQTCKLDILKYPHKSSKQELKP